MDFNETKLRFGDVAMQLQAVLASKDSCPIASSIYSGRGSRADCRFGDCAIFRTTVCRRRADAETGS